VFESLTPEVSVENCNDENIYELPDRVHFLLDILEDKCLLV